ncbi:MAG: branched-chain amino acid ABC transporter permease [Chloroflexota bacterium]|nr:branched-chain amino acid ABC transporter permease [Chloroflexota bacterium]MDE3193985.1 branched-chain amino acid ABC transporter permease [Chloroflexota bacterium]
MTTSLVIDGLIYGLQLSLLAVGLTLIFGLGGVMNLAHGQFAVVAGITAALLMAADVPAPLAAVVAILAAGALGLVVDRSLMLAAYRRSGEQRLLFGLLMTLGLSFVIEGFLNFAFPETALSIETPLPALTIFGTTVRSASAVVALIAVVTLLGLLAFLREAPLGQAIRCVIQSEVGAQLCGIDPSRLRTIIFVLGTLLAGLVGITQGLTASIDPNAGLELTVFALIVATVGGVRSILGTTVAGLLLGVVHAFTSFYIGAYLTFIIFLVTAVATILVRPRGLLGHWT